MNLPNRYAYLIRTDTFDQYHLEEKEPTMSDNVSPEANTSFHDMIADCANFDAWKRLGSDVLAEAVREILRLEDETEKPEGQDYHIPRVAVGAYADPARDGLD